MKILIDNGHGRTTKGKCSPDKRLLEYAENRLLANGIVTKLTLQGYDASLLVPEDDDILLSERCKRVNRFCYALGTSNVILVSIHCNAAQIHIPGYRLRMDWTDNDPDIESNFYLLRHTACPAVLTENMFMDAKADCDFLLSPEGQQALIDLHVTGIKFYLGIH